LKVSSGEFLGVMGHTGAGKSTILKLIERFYEPQHGKVLINGKDINNYSIKSVRSKIGFVSQDPFFFTGLSSKMFPMQEMLRMRKYLMR
jgi:ABC-type multidrug transport system fused ATPase/permease subunit